MRIAYVVSWDIGAESGVLKKIRDQIGCWEAEGERVRLFASSPQSRPWVGLGGIEVHALSHRKRFMGPVQWARLARSVDRWRPDVVYLRFSTWKPALEWLAGRVPTVVEVNTNDLAEYKLLFSRPGFELHRLTRARLFARASGAIALTHELAEGLASTGVPCEVIANGIDFDSVQTSPAPDNSEPRLFFIGSPGFPWHGVDEIVALARLRPSWRFDVVGPGAGTFSGETPGNVCLHGALDKAHYAPLLAGADVAIGTMALHRKKMDEACPLKVREYLAAGLPTVLAYRDTDFLDPPDFLLELPNRAGTATENVSRIDDFVASWKGRRVPRAAVSHLDVKVKEARRLALMSRFMT